MFKAVLILLVCLFPSYIIAAGFDCKKAKTDIEKLICGNQALDELDSKLSSLYKLARENLGLDRVEELTKEQRQWLKVRNKICKSVDHCIFLYRHRVEALETWSQWTDSVNEITPLQLYMRFNMRTIFSSYGQRVKYYCASYPFEYFPKSQMYIKGGNTLVLDNGEDYWEISITGGTVEILNQIRGGTYNSTSSYSVEFNSSSREYRAKETFIKKGGDCEIYVAEKI